MRCAAAMCAIAGAPNAAGVRNRIRSVSCGNCPAMLVSWVYNRGPQCYESATARFLGKGLEHCPVQQGPKGWSVQRSERNRVVYGGN